MIIEQFGCIPFGGDYCPEQWDEATWQEDIRLMQELGVNTVTINVHSWVMNQPAEGVFDYSKLDKIVDLLTDAGIRIIMGTATTAVPNWMGKKYPEIMMMDINDLHYTTGRREIYCTNSPDYRREVKTAVEHLAERYQNNQNIKLWHMANEVGIVCYCDNCAKAYRRYLRKKFGTLDNLNEQWTTAFWGHTYTDWEQIDPPKTTTEFAPNMNGIDGFDCHFRSTEAIEYLRFFSESLRECYEIERDAIHKYIPDALVTNNFQFRTLDYRRVCAASSVIAYDSYPAPDEHPAKSAMCYDICRGLHAPGKNFMLMEMTPSQASWAQTVPVKRPGEVELIALKGLGHGADSSLFFQIRKNRSGFEKFHGAMIDHCGHVNTRTGRELQSLAKKLKAIEPYLSETHVHAKVAVILDFDTMYGVEIPCSIQKRMNYMNEVEYYYRYFNERNIAVDILPATADLSGYSLVVAPMLYMLPESFGQEITRYVQSGGSFVTTYYSGMADLNDCLYPGGYPGILKDVCGLWVEETDALTANQHNRVKTDSALGGQDYSCGFMCDVIHLTGAKSLGVYAEDFYAGTPCICENSFGAGRAIYIGTKLEAGGVDAVLDYAVQGTDVAPVLAAPAGVEICLREGEKHGLLFLVNNTTDLRTVAIPSGWEALAGEAPENGVLILSGKGSAVLLRK